MTRNIVLICLDSVRKDYFDSLADRLRSKASSSFENARAASTCSAPSHASMMTGELPEVHRVYSHNPWFDVDRNNTFLGILRDHRAIGVSSNTFAGSPFKFDSLFDDFVDVSPERRFAKGIDVEEYMNQTEASGMSQYLGYLKTALKSDHPIPSLANGAYLFLDRKLLHEAPIPRLFDDGTNAVLKAAENRFVDKESPFVGFLNLMEAHAPMAHSRVYDGKLHDAPDSWSSQQTLPYDELNVHGGFEQYEVELENYRGLYGATVEYLDRKVAAFIDTVQNQTERETTFIVTADHGEMLVERDSDPLFGHNVPRVSEELLHVPLEVINPPEGTPDCVEKPVSHLHLPSLLKGFAEGEYVAPGTDVVVAERLTSVLPGKFGLSGADAERWWQTRRCAYVDGRKITWTSEGDCWESSIDGSSTESLVQELDSPPSEVTVQFENEIETLRSELGIGSGLDTSTVGARVEGRLEDLGYL
ncbi:sulfatase-like hydrolase/transferase [Haloterrigena sp. SYSU A558-1]|uniref:Sulfatase-like hydrolase/transferase n=1 Tax=Haloterrigena gelatinilytica TaxID=2741724 RepID=A0ABX2L3J7_9EURY|nr:sulfatase-like hydrolase/transferase [Haloterrigena gelatinilytica]NUC70870.1 sulfatase-like hydrolase/transferase [Haloterrigena gelatinilytica]